MSFKAYIFHFSVLLLNAGSLRKPPGLYVFHLASADSLLLLSLPFVWDSYSLDLVIDAL